MARSGFDYDVIMIGSGFGRSVTAVRAVEKGWIERIGSPAPAATAAPATEAG
jgi:hypothetical protein